MKVKNEKLTRMSPPQKNNIYFGGTGDVPLIFQHIHMCNTFSSFRIRAYVCSRAMLHDATLLSFALFLFRFAFYFSNKNKSKHTYKFDYILRELPTCNNPYRSSISRNEYSFAWAGLCMGTGGCICDAPVLGGPVVIVLHDSYANTQNKSEYESRREHRNTRTHKQIKNKRTNKHHLMRKNFALSTNSSTQQQVSSHPTP